MSTKTIPAREVTICDRCNCECIEAAHDVGMRLTGKRWGYGPSGGRINGAEVEYDFCHHCTMLFNEWLGERGSKTAESGDGRFHADSGPRERRFGDKD